MKLVELLARKSISPRLNTVYKIMKDIQVPDPAAYAALLYSRGLNGSRIPVNLKYLIPKDSTKYQFELYYINRHLDNPEFIKAWIGTVKPSTIQRLKATTEYNNYQSLIEK